MISTKTIQLLTFRIQQEELSSRIYEQMSLWLANKGYKGASAVWTMFSKEELEHAQKAKDFLLSFGLLPELSALEEPENVFKDISDIINKTYEHEVTITNQCNELAKYAIEKEIVLLPLALSYVEIQVKEMEEVTDLKDILALSSDKLVLDEYLKETFLD